jgi:ATP-dependent Clp protease adapter protein ClpS
LSSPGILEREELADQSQKDRGYLVRVYNNEYNTYEEVIFILILATKCDFDEAEMETWEIDHLGSSVVHVASQEDCQKAASIISQIGIRVEVAENL